MRILVYGLNMAPELTGIGKYTGEMVDWLVARGHEIRVITAPPYYPAWKIREDYRDSFYRVERPQARNIVFRCPLWVPVRPRTFNRIVHLLSFAASSLPVVLAQAVWRPKLIFVVQPTMFSSPAALLIGGICGAKTWLHIQDFEVDAAFELSLLKQDGPVRSLTRSFEKTLTRCFDRVSSISEKMVERLSSKGIEPERSVLFPNWVDTKAIFPVSRETAYRREHGLENKILFCYSGNMGVKQGLDSLAPLAAAFLDDDRVHFLFSGDGAFRPQLEAALVGMPNVTLLPIQPFERLNDLLGTADVHLLPQLPGVADLVMPSKLIGMLSSGRPVIATADPGTQVEKIVTGRGIVVRSGDTPGLVGAVKTLANNEDLRLSLGRAAGEYELAHLERDAVLLQFEQAFQQLVEASQR